MALIVEDGTGVADADTYVSAATHVAYCLLYGITKTEAQAEIDLRKAMDYIESRIYKGNLLYPDANTLLFPRTLIYNYALMSDDDIMITIRKAQNEIAKSIGEGYDPLARTERLVKTKTFDKFSKTYEDGDSSYNPKVDLFLSPLLLVSDGGGIVFKTSVGNDYGC